MEVTAKGILFKISERFKLTRDTIEDRLKLQKTIYLLEEFGLNLGYGFGWYKYGPYSGDLVQDAHTVLYAERERYSRETAKWKFSTDSESRFKEFENRLGNVLDDAEMLELVASVHFMRETWKPEINKNDIVSKFKQYKKCYLNKKRIEDEEIKKAFDISQQLISSSDK